MRRILVFAVLAALALAGCGSSSSSSGSPLNTELSYFPAGSPAVAVVATDPNGSAWQDASGFVARFPLAKLAIAALQSDMAKSGVNYAQDIQPLLGNPVALGVPTTTSASSSSFLLVLIAKDASQLNALTQKQPAPQSAGSYDGAKLYQGGTFALATDGATALLAPSLTTVKSALDLHAHGGGITQTNFNKAFTGLPQNPLLQVYGDLTGVLSRPQAAQARQIPWVGALSSYGLTVSVADTGIDIHYRVNTSGASLTDSELPLPTGSTAPSVAGTGPVVVGFGIWRSCSRSPRGPSRPSTPRRWRRSRPRPRRTESRSTMTWSRSSPATASLTTAPAVCWRARTSPTPRPWRARSPSSRT